MDNFGAIMVALIGSFAAVASVVALVFKSRGENKREKANSKLALNDRIDARISLQLNTAWDRIDELGTKILDLETKDARRSGAITRILRAIANQWPESVAGPNLHPDDIAEIEETIPQQWIRK